MGLLGQWEFLRAKQRLKFRNALLIGHGNKEPRTNILGEVECVFELER